MHLTIIFIFRAFSPNSCIITIFSFGFIKTNSHMFATLAISTRITFLGFINQFHEFQHFKHFASFSFKTWIPINQFQSFVHFSHDHHARKLGSLTFPWIYQPFSTFSAFSENLYERDPASSYKFDESTKTCDIPFKVNEIPIVALESRLARLALHITSRVNIDART